MLRAMRLTRVFAVGLVAALALAAAGCGGGNDGDGAGAGPATSEGAGFIPATAAGFVFLNTDFESDGWKALDALLDKFPDREQVLSQLRSSLAEGGVTMEEIEAAVGPEVDIGILGFEGESNAVGLTQAKDKAKLDELIQKLDAADDSGSPAVKEEVDGWTLISDNQAAIDAAKRAHGGASIADSDAYKEAMGDLSEDALLRFYLDGAALSRQLDAQTQGAASSLAGGGTVKSIAGEVTAEDEGFGFDFVTRTTGGSEPKTYSSKLIDLVPADVLAYASFSGLGQQLKQVSSNPQLQSQLGFVQGALGVSFTDLASLFEGEAAFYVRQGSPFPEVTLALTVDNEQQALATIDQLAMRLGALLGGGATAAPTPTKIGDVDAKRLSLGNFAAYYATFDGKLVLTSATTGISGLKGGGEKLGDDATFDEAQQAAGMADETAGFFYVNIEDALPVIENFAQTAGEPFPAQARSNLEPLQSLLFYATAEKGKATVKGFLHIK
jgi:hypothetical protein